jgi:hypothetical protein
MTVLKRATLLGGALVALTLLGEENRHVTPSGATASPTLAAGALELRASFGMTSTDVPCPPEAGSAVIACRARTGTASVSGLGIVSLAYVWSYGWASRHALECFRSLSRQRAV